MKFLKNMRYIQQLIKWGGGTFALLVWDKKE